MGKIYLAYGSNLNKGQMKFRCPDAHALGTAWIDGYRLLFKGSRTGSYLTIEKYPNGRVPVGVWYISDKDERTLDNYEGYPIFYYKKNFEITLNETGGMFSGAMAYIMNERNPLGLPSEAYLRTCLLGYEQFGFDKKYLQQALDDTKGGMKK